MGYKKLKAEDIRSYGDEYMGMSGEWEKVTEKSVGLRVGAGQVRRWEKPKHIPDELMEAAFELIGEPHSLDDLLDKVKFNSQAGVYSDYSDLPWDGKHLPPVGTKCEVHHSSTPAMVHRWLPCEIIHRHHTGVANVAVYIVDDGNRKMSGQAVEGNFRVIKTEKQIAFEEKQEVVDIMMAALNSDDPSVTLRCCELYDLRYGITDDD